MGKMKELVIEICEDYQRGIPVQDIANAHGLSVTEVLRIVEQYS